MKFDISHEKFPYTDQLSPSKTDIFYFSISKYNVKLTLSWYPSRSIKLIDVTNQVAWILGKQFLVHKLHTSHMRMLYYQICWSSIKYDNVQYTYHVYCANLLLVKRITKGCWLHSRCGTHLKPSDCDDKLETGCTGKEERL